MKTFFICLMVSSVMVYVANIPQSVTHCHQLNDSMAVAPPKRPSVYAAWSKAVAKVESNHRTRARRFEPHIFTRLSGQSASTIEEAKKLNWRAAMYASSHGKHQILGKWWRVCGYKNIESMVKANSEEQDLAFVRFVTKMKYDKYIRAKDFKRFARAYNGSGYKRNRYDVKLKNALEELS